MRLQKSRLQKMFFFSSINLRRETDSDSSEDLAELGLSLVNVDGVSSPANHHWLVVG